MGVSAVGGGVAGGLIGSGLGAIYGAGAAATTGLTTTTSAATTFGKGLLTLASNPGQAFVVGGNLMAGTAIGYNGLKETTRFNATSQSVWQATFNPGNMASSYVTGGTMGLSWAAGLGVKPPASQTTTTRQATESSLNPKNVAQYEKMKEALAVEEIQSVVNTTKHGAERLLERDFSPSDISALKLTPDKIMTQADGAQVFIKDIGNGKFNLIVESENGVVTALKNISEKSLNNLSKNYGWK